MLTEEEKRILVALVKGASNRQIAESLNIPDATVKRHLRHIMKKLGVANRTQAAIWAYHNLENDDA